MTPDEAVAETPLPPLVPAVFLPGQPLALGTLAGQIGRFSDGRLQSPSGAIWGVMQATGPDSAADLKAKYELLPDAVGSRTGKALLEMAFGRVPAAAFDAAAQAAVAVRLGAAPSYFLFCATFVGSVAFRVPNGAAALEFIVGAGPAASGYGSGVSNGC